MNKISNDKKCDYNDFKRARYFDGELMNKPIFFAEQLYHTEKRKLHNRMLHGWGVVCGLKVRQTDTKSSSIIIESGLALDCAGNEIFVCEPYTLNVVETINSCTGQSTSDECTSKEEVENKWYVVIRYKEVPTDPVPIYVQSGGCEEKGCEHSRVREGYCLDLCRTVPCAHRKPDEKCDPCKDLENEEEIREFLCEKLLLPCTGGCCDHPQVVLGSITFAKGITSETKIENSMINNWDCRKYVITFGLLQHWMTLLAPKKVPLEAIVDYKQFSDACESIESAQKALKDICDQNTDDQNTGDQKLSIIKYKVYDKETLNVERGLNEKGEPAEYGGYYAMVGNRVALNGDSRKLVDLIYEQKAEEPQFFSVPRDWPIGDVWKVVVEDIDSENKVKFLLYKNNVEKIQKEVYKGDVFTYIEDKVPLFVTYVYNIFRDPSHQQFVHLKYTWAVKA